LGSKSVGQLVKIIKMKFLKFLLVGIFFGIVLVKSEAVSWYRIYEMFKFQSFHMYGIIGSAVSLGILFIWLFKKFKVRSTEGQEIDLVPKDKGVVRYILGGTIFGLGWALAGACPGPMYILVGTGIFSMLIVIAAALLGTFAYGLLQKKLPH
jgi:uncharacterized membrane protein YedE/YeeE